MNDEKIRYPANLAGIPDGPFRYPVKFPGLGEALIFFSHPFLVSRQEKDVGARGQRPLPRCYMRRTVKIWPFPPSWIRPCRVVCGAYSIRPYPGQQKTKNEQQKSRVRAGRIQLRTRHFLRSVLGRYALSLSDVGDRNNIGKHTRCGHVGTGAVALDNHRILVITLGGDHNNVVASLQFVERMGATNFL